MTATLRFGVLADGGVLAEWQVRCIDDLIENAGARFDAFISSDARSVQGRAWRWFEKAVAVTKVPGLAPVDWRKKFPSVREYGAHVRSGGAPALTLDPSERQVLRGLNLAFILDFSAHDGAAELLDLAAAGVWSFQLNDVSKYDGRIPGFWEISRGDSLVKCALVQRVSAAPPRVLRSGVFRAAIDSYPITAQVALAACRVWPRLAWNARQTAGGARVALGDVAATASTRAVPGLWRVATFFLRLGVSRLRLMFRWWLMREQWCVGLVDRPIHHVLKDGIKQVRWLFRDKRDGYFADPFGVVSGGELVVFAEEYPHDTCRGKISSFTVRDGSVVTPPRTVLELDGHLSYPFLFQHQGQTYCIPESNQLGEVALYRIDRLPDRWVRVKTLLADSRYVDSTVIEHDGRWWLFASSMEYEGIATLYIWHAADLFGEWVPHRLNPVKTDVRASRPAGTPFVHEGALYRPAQNCTVTYGGSITLNRVTRLTPDEFEEDVAIHIQPERPGPFPLGLHTLSAVGQQTLVDGKTYVMSPGQFVRVLRSKLRRVLPWPRLSAPNRSNNATR